MTFKCKKILLGAGASKNFDGSGSSKISWLRGSGLRLRLPSPDNDNNNEQFFNIGSLANSNSLKSKINAYLTVKEYASFNYKTLFNLNTAAEVNIVPKKFIDKMSLTLDATKITLSGIGNGIVKPCGKVILRLV